MSDKRKIVSLCMEFLEENGIDIEKSEVEKNVYGKLYSNQLITGDDLGIPDINFAISRVDSAESFSLVESKLKETIDDLVMLILTSSVEYYKKAEKEINKRKQNNNNIKVLMTGVGRNSKTHSIRIKSRIQAVYDEIDVPRTRKKTEKVKGCVYSAFLSDIVKIYNEIGDELFKKNVRLKVTRDKIGVGKEIKETLKNNPEQFWFFNNGITIVTDSPIDMSNNKHISLTMDDKVSFSVVNGAQTISAAHEYIYCEGESKSAKANAEKALVLLRVVSIEEMEATNDIAVDSSESMSESISKALNRQKPIVAEDLAYYSPFVKGVNGIYAEVEASSGSIETDNRFFCIVRRGENENDNDNKYEHSLTKIARAIRASGYIKDSSWNYAPWKAINTYNADILKMNQNDLKHDELFKTDMVGNNADFLKHYQYVNLAIYLYKYFAEAKNKIDTSVYSNPEKINSLRENGTWYFVAFFFEYLLVNNLEKKLKSNCVDDFADFISENEFIEMISFFFMVMDDGCNYTTKDLRQEETYKKIASSIRAYDKEYKLNKLNAQKLYVAYENGDILKYNNYEAYVKVKNDKLILTKGSKIENSIDKFCSQFIKELREDTSNIVNSDDGTILQDISFEDLSTLAKYIEGRRVVKGYNNWKKI